MSAKSTYHTIASKPLSTAVTKEESLEVFYLYAMYELSIRAHHINSIHDFCKLVVFTAIDKLDFDRIGILLLNDDLTMMRGTWGVDVHGEVIDESSFSAPITDELVPILDQVRDRGQIIVWQDTDIVDFDTQHGGIKQYGKGWNAGYAFWINDDHPIGWVAADNVRHQQPFSSLHQQLFRMLGDLVGDFIRNQTQQQKINSLNQQLQKEQQQLTELNEQLRTLSIRDELTGLYNRRFLFDTFNANCSRSTREGRIICCMMVDIDHFKSINDQYGHQQGDIALKAVAECLKNAIRPHDVLARFGGEEFCLILEIKQLHEASICAERIRAKIAAIECYHQTTRLPLTASFGVYACIPNANCNLDKLIQHADLMLYQAKHNGRNRIEVRTSDQVTHEDENATKP